MSPPKQAFLYFHVDYETDLREGIWCIAVCAFSVFVLCYVLLCAGDDLFSRHRTDDRICSQGARGTVFPLPIQIIRLVGDEAIMSLFDSPSFDWTHALRDFKSTTEIDWSEWSCVGRFPSSFAKSAVVQAETFPMLGRRRCTDEELQLTETIPKVIFTWLSKNYIPYRDAELAVSR